MCLHRREGRAGQGEGDDHADDGEDSNEEESASSKEDSTSRDGDERMAEDKAITLGLVMGDTL